MMRSRVVSWWPTDIGRAKEERLWLLCACLVASFIHRTHKGPEDRSEFHFKCLETLGTCKSCGPQACQSSRPGIQALVIRSNLQRRIQRCFSLWKSSGFTLWEVLIDIQRRLKFGLWSCLVMHSTDIPLPPPYPHSSKVCQFNSSETKFLIVTETSSCNFPSSGWVAATTFWLLGPNLESLDPGWVYLLYSKSSLPANAVGSALKRQTDSAASPLFHGCLPSPSHHYLLLGL